MKIVFLNIWGGKVFDPLTAFVKESAADTDFFCFQEVFDSPEAREVTRGRRANIFSELRNILPQFQSYYAPVQKEHDGDLWLGFDCSHGLAIFVKESIPVDDSGDIIIHGERNGLRDDDLTTYPCNLQYIRFHRDSATYTLCNTHGTAWPGSKLDTPERLAQSQKTVDFLAREQGEKILGGDFNLLPDTASIRMIEHAGMRNLIKEFGVSTTRNELAWARYPEAERQCFSDYVFVSSEVRVISFSAPQLAISDHLPLVLEVA